MLSKGGRVFVSCRHQILDQQQLSRNNIHMARLCKTTTVNISSWWRHQMETFSALPALYGGNSSESTCQWWISLTKASYAKLWYFPWSAPQQTVQQTIETQVIWFVKHVVQYSALAIRCLTQLLSAIPCLFTTTANILNICIFNPLIAECFREKHSKWFMLSTILKNWDCTGSWTPSSWKASNQSYIPPSLWYKTHFSRQLDC